MLYDRTRHITKQMSKATRDLIDYCKSHATNREEITAQIKKFLEAGANIDGHDIEPALMRITPLCVAISKLNVEMVQCILEAGCDPSICSLPAQKTGLQMAKDGLEESTQSGDLIRKAAYQKIIDSITSFISLDRNNLSI